MHDLTAKETGSTMTTKMPSGSHSAGTCSPDDMLFLKLPSDYLTYRAAPVTLSFYWVTRTAFFGGIANDSTPNP